MKKILPVFILLILIGTFITLFTILPANAAAELKPYIESVEQAKEGMTLWQMIKTGGFVMLVLAVLSIIAMALTIYDFMTLKVNKLSPKNFAEDVIQKLEGGKHKLVETMCESEPNIIASIVTSGLERKDKGPLLAREAMENCTRKEIGNLWQNISYLADIAAIAPLIGLLGTVLGMIQAFNVIAFQTAVVKPILLAGGVSKAMVTTAGGLIVAIPVMLFYAYFKGKVQEIANVVESYSTDITKIIEEA